MLVVELNALFPVVFLEAQQVVAFGEQVVTLPYATHAASTDVETLLSQLLRDPQWTMVRSGEGVVEDGLPNLGSDSVGMIPFTAGQFVEQGLCAIDLVITANFVELLTAVTDDLQVLLTLLSSLVCSSRCVHDVLLARWWSYGDSRGTVLLSGLKPYDPPFL